MRPLKLQTNRTGMIALLEDCVRVGGTHVHLKVPGRPQLRIDGQLSATQHERLGPEDVQSAVVTLLELAREEQALAGRTDLRVAFGVEGLGSFRAQLGRQRGSWGVVIQRVSTDPPGLGALGLPEAVATAVEVGSGLIVVAGGRGRSAILAALIRQYNQSCYGHLVSLEDPLEYLHADLRASVTQREVGHDLPDFYSGLVAAMRQDPDALVLTDVPDLREAEAVIRLAEEGLLVVAGVSTSDGLGALRALLRRYPSNRQAEALGRLSGALLGVVWAPKEGPAQWQGREDALRDAFDGT